MEIPRFWAGAAMAWALLFAATSFYWASGGTLGTSTLGGITNDVPALVIWGTGLLKVAAAVAAGLLGVRRLRSLGLAGVIVTGIVCAVYGAANLGVRLLMALGVIHTPAGMHSEAAYWHLVLWDPWWLAGGVIFLLAGLRSMDGRKRSRQAGHSL